MSNDRLKILLVDDEPVNLQFLKGALREEYDIFESPNGFDAIEQIKKTMPDLILLDVMMPDISGFDVSRIIRSEEAFSAIPILFLTGKDTLEDELEGLEAGGIDYLRKPVNIRLLKVRVHNHLELTRKNNLIREQRDQLVRKNEELESALGRIKRLEGIIPICSYCKKIRDDQQSWQKLETYISRHSEAVFSHGACPECAAEQFKIIKNMKIHPD